MTRPIRVLVVDDSATVRQTLTRILSEDAGIQVIAAAADPFAAARAIAKEVPDVVTLDVEMPRMDGITFLRKLMAQHPIPVVMCSSLTEAHSQTLMEALDAGAVDVILKPRVETRQFLEESRVRICDAVKAAARAELGNLPRRKPRVGMTEREGGVSAKLSADAVLPAAGPRRNAMSRTTEQIVCIGASTGGTESLRAILETLPADCPAIVVVQHMPEHFTAAFAKRLNGICRVDVKEAEDGDPLLRGRVLIAPGNRHTLVQRSGARYAISVRDGPLVSRHRPSVDVLFRSAAQFAGANALGILMTGMGDDGAHGLLEMRQAGARTVAQDEATSVVFGMPRAAIELSAAERVLPLDLIAGHILQIDSR
jgi:two-component system chemotaxis response regulator CheB